MSDRVSWETCPNCGGRVAIGWTEQAPAGTAGPVEEPVEADCVTGCDLTDVQRHSFVPTAPASS